MVAPVYGAKNCKAPDVTNDEFSLATPNRDHGVDGGDARREGLVDGSTVQNTRRGRFQASTFSACGGLPTLANTLFIDDTTLVARSHRDIGYGSRGSYDRALNTSAAVAH